MTQPQNGRGSQENLPDFDVSGADCEFLGTARELMELGPAWRGANGQTLLHLVAGSCKLGWIRELVARGWDPNEHSVKGGTTPLQLLVMHFPYRDDPTLGANCLAALLAAGAEVDCPDDGGDTSLHYAVTSNNPDAVRLLLKAGAKVDHEGSSASTPLDAAVRVHLGKSKNGSSEIVQLLLDAGADANHRNESGGTPLIWSASCNPEITRILLAAGADPTIVDDEGETALDSALESCPEAVDLIRASLIGKNANGT